MASAQDAELILHLYELRREPVLRQARDWFAREFNPKSAEEMRTLVPPGSEANRYFRMVTTYWEMATSLLAHGAVDEALFLDNCGEALMVWRKLAGVIEAIRAERNQPRYLMHVEAAFRRWEAARAKR